MEGGKAVSSFSVDEGVRGEQRACCFRSNKGMNSLRNGPGIMRAIEASGCSLRCLYILRMMFLSGVAGLHCLCRRSTTFDSIINLGLLSVSCICMRARFWSGGGLKPEVGSYRRGCVSQIRGGGVRSCRHPQHIGPEFANLAAMCITARAW
jgi:hypothetical protein